MIFRRATIEDCDLLFEWANEPAVRQNSFNSEKIKYEDHVKWFENKISLLNCLIFICEDEGKPVGQIRIEKEENQGLINFSVDGNCRGKGYGKKMLEDIGEALIQEKSGVTELIGRVKPENTASRKAFEGAGYSKIELSEFIEYHKKV